MYNHDGTQLASHPVEVEYKLQYKNLTSQSFWQELLPNKRFVDEYYKNPQIGFNKSLVN